MLITRSGMKVMGESAAARMLIGRTERKVDEVILLTKDTQPTLVLVPYEIWFQIQHFVSQVIER